MENFKMLSRLKTGSLFSVFFVYELGMNGDYVEAPEGTEFICLKLYKEPIVSKFDGFWICYCFNLKKMVSISSGAGTVEEFEE